jgi:uncharacterized GH25 family protein/thiol-disulfide isomerase/thioredoxin
MVLKLHSPLSTIGEVAMTKISNISRRLDVIKKRVFSLPLYRRSTIGFGSAALLAVGVLGILQFTLAAPPATDSIAAADKPKESTEKPAQPDKSGAITPKAGSFRVRVLDPQGKPLSEAKVHASIWTEEKSFKANRDYKTDADGAAQVELPKTYFLVRLWAGKKPFVTMFSHWERNELASGTRLPEEYTIWLEPGVTAGGRILDKQGQPIAGAKVQVMLRGATEPFKGDGRTSYDIWLATGNDAATTDAEGRWRIDNVPNNAQGELSLLVSHPDFISDDSWGQLQNDAGITTAMLRNETATLTLKRGISVQGQVTNPAGKPIKDAIVVQGDDPYSSNMPCKFPTDADGRFKLPALPLGERTLTVIAPGWAPQMRRVDLKADLPPQNFRMAPGKPIELRFVDTAGKPIPNVSVSITEWKGSKSLQSMHNPNHPKVPDTKIPPRADKNGVWKWDSAPDDPVELETYMKGFASCELEIAGGAPPRTVTLKPAHRITGRVTDALTGKPIPAFTVIPIDVFRKDWLHAERFNAVAGKDGRLDYLATRTDIPLRLRIEAAGYRTQTGPEFRVGDDTSRTQNFRLQPSEPIVGIVLDAAGRSVEKAEVLLATPTEEAGLYKGIGNHKSFTDAEGHFTFPDPGEPVAVAVHAHAGFAQADFPADQHDLGTLRLQSWASISGQFRDGGQPVRNATIILQPVRLDGLDQPRIDATIQTVTGADGRFEFPRVSPVPVSVRVYLGPWRDEGFRSGPSVPLDLKPGQHADLDLGDAGAIVKGKVILSGKVPTDLDCTYSLNYLISRSPGITPPPSIANIGFDVRNGWQATWHKTQEGRAYLSTLRYWFVKLAPDGTFRISGVPPGKYDLAIEIYAKPSGCLVDPLARKIVHVTVTPEDVARVELSLPEIAAAVVPVPVVGDMPSLSFQYSDGATGSLSDFRGKSTVVHFWATWCGPCKRQLPTLRQLQERFAARGMVMLGLSLDDDSAAWQAALKQLDLPWQQGRLNAAGVAGVSSVPAYWLLDPAGKIVAKVYDPDELAAAVDKTQTRPTEK